MCIKIKKKKGKKKSIYLNVTIGLISTKGLRLDDANPRKILINGEKVDAFFKLRCFALMDIIA